MFAQCYAFGNVVLGLITVGSIILETYAKFGMVVANP